MTIDHPYVEMRDERPFVRGHRIPINALAALWRDGASIEAIHDNYPSLSIALILGGLAYYLDHQEVIHAQLAEDEATFSRLKAEYSARYPERAAQWEQRRAAIRMRQGASAS